MNFHFSQEVFLNLREARDEKFWTTPESFGILAHNFVLVPVTNNFLSVFSFDRISKNVSMGYAAVALKIGSKALQQGKLF